MNLELFERAAGAGGQLLRVDRQRSRASASAQDGSAPSFLLTFDVGRILVRADPMAGGLRAEFVESQDEVSTDLASAEEEEPWWRLLGIPLGGAVAEERGIRLQFRGEVPRSVRLEADGGLVRARLELEAKT